MQKSWKLRIIFLRLSLPVFLNLPDMAICLASILRKRATSFIMVMGSNRSSSYPTVMVGRWKKEIESRSSRSLCSTKSSHLEKVVKLKVIL